MQSFYLTISGFIEECKGGIGKKRFFREPRPCRNGDAVFQSPTEIFWISVWLAPGARSTLLSKQLAASTQTMP